MYYVTMAFAFATLSVTFCLLCLLSVFEYLDLKKTSEEQSKAFVTIHDYVSVAAYGSLSVSILTTFLAVLFSVGSLL